MSDGVASAAGGMAQATPGMGGKPSKRTIKGVKKASRTRFKDFRMKTKVVPTKKSKAKKRGQKHKGRGYDE
jgi:hypothetical protein